MSYHFDESAASKACGFFRDVLTLTKGRDFAGGPFILQGWQEKIIRDLFGWMREDGTRRYRTAYIEVPRKNGKSELAAGIALYLLLCDGETGAEIYSAAADQKQSKLVYDAARQMVRQSVKMSGRVHSYQFRITYEKASSFYQALSSEAFSKHGLNASGIIFDELHAQPDRELWDVLTTSTGSRTQPLTVAITTAGHDRSSICWEMHERAKMAIRDPDSDPSFYPVIYGADDADDWTDPNVWAKANPNLGVSIKLDYLKEKCDEALRFPAAENTFRNLHLNQWVRQSKRAIPMHLWDACYYGPTEKNPEIQWPDLSRVRCYAGLDLASTKDVNALCLVWRHNGRIWVKPFFWVPKDSVGDRQERDRRQVIAWAEKGKITTMPGNSTDYPVLSADVAKILKAHNVEKLIIDDWLSRDILQRLTDEGIPIGKIERFKQSLMNYAAPTKEFDRLVAAGELAHDGDDVLRWMAENYAVYTDGNGNMKPMKNKSGDKIDGIVAAIMGLSGLLEAPKPTGPGVAARSFALKY